MVRKSETLQIGCLRQIRSAVLFSGKQHRSDQISMEGNVLRNVNEYPRTVIVYRCQNSTLINIDIVQLKNIALAYTI